ncbi:MAG: alpha/beta hydrolase [bacterium]
MKTAIILHGMPSKTGYYDPKRESQSNEHWLPWLQRQLLLKDVLAQTPEWPKPYDPDYKAWSKVFDQFHVGKDTLLIGHSCGAGFLVRWLSEHKIKVGKVILVAPWINPDKKSGRKLISSEFFNFKIDKNLLKRTKGITIFNSIDDYADIQQSVKVLRETIPGIRYREFKNRGHFCYNDMKTRKFPELLKEVLK